MPGPLRREHVIGHVLFVSLRCLFLTQPGGAPQVLKLNYIAEISVRKLSWDEECRLGVRRDPLCVPRFSSSWLKRKGVRKRRWLEGFGCVQFQMRLLHSGPLYRIILNVWLLVSIIQTEFHLIAH